MNEPLDPDDDTVDLNEAVMESAALPINPPVPPVAATVWDEPAGSEGSRAPVIPDSESETIAEKLAQAGNEEAGSEQRMAAGEQFPPT